MQECSRFIIGLRDAGWSDTQINDFILYIETGDKTSQNPPDNWWIQLFRLN